MPLQVRRVSNSPSMLALVNKGRKHMARKKKAKKSRSYKSKKRSGGHKKAASHRSHRPAAHKRANPKRHHKRKVYASHKKRRHHTKRRNPGLFGSSAGVFAEAVNFSIAGFAIQVGNGYVQPLVSRFVPGQFAAPVSKAVTGFGLGWVADKFTITRRFSRALRILGVALAVTDLVAPYVRGFIGGGKAAGPQGRFGPRGIGVWVPPPGQAQWLNAAPPGAQQAGPQGVGNWQQAYRR